MADAFLTGFHGQQGTNQAITNLNCAFLTLNYRGCQNFLKRRQQNIWLRSQGNSIIFFQQIHAQHDEYIKRKSQWGGGGYYFSCSKIGLEVWLLCFVQDRKLKCLNR